MAATYSLSVDRERPLSSSSCRNDNIRDMLQEIGSAPQAVHQAEKTDHLRA